MIFHISKAIITAYIYTSHLASNGQYPTVGCVAISDRHIHLGSKCVIDGIGVFTITDHMNKRYNNDPIRIDVYVGHNVKVARKFGCQKHNITIYE